jgi:hypothetical protein
MRGVFLAPFSKQIACPKWILFSSVFDCPIRYELISKLVARYISSTELSFSLCS